MPRTVQENGVALILKAGDLLYTEIGALKFFFSYASRQDVRSPGANLPPRGSWRGRGGTGRNDRDGSVSQRRAGQRISSEVIVDGKRAKIVRRQRAGTAFGHLFIGVEDIDRRENVAAGRPGIGQLDGTVRRTRGMGIDKVVYQQPVCGGR